MGFYFYHVETRKILVVTIKYALRMRLVQEIRRVKGGGDDDEDGGRFEWNDNDQYRCV
jgi:hypothetical protein